jgi:molybdopterin converting factor small subunit
MNILVKYFGRLTDISKTGSETVQVDSTATAHGLMQLLYTKYKGLQGETFIIFKNQLKLTDENLDLKENDEISLMPPFSGG